jgi:hypothetical protein
LNIFYVSGLTLRNQFQKHGSSQQHGQSDANAYQQPIDIFGFRLGVGMQIIQEILPEEKIQAGDRGTCQQEIFRNLKEISFG